MSDLPLSSSLFIAFILLVLSGFLSLSESTMFSLGRHQREVLKKQGKKSSSFIERLLKDPYQLIITILLADEVCNIAYTSSIALIVSGFLIGTSGEMLTLISIAIASPTLLIVGEIVPKTLGVKFPRSISRFIAYPLYSFHRLITPFRWVIMLLSIAFIWVFGVRNGRKSGVDMSAEDEVKALVELAGDHGVVTDIEKTLVESLFKLNDIPAYKIMTPSIDLFTLPARIPAHEALGMIKARAFSRIPVYKDDRDNIVGILFAKDLLTSGIPPNDPIEKILRPPTFIPRTKKGLELLTEFQQKRTHMAIVVDEYGRVDGLVTMEDLLEELFGEFKDERRTASMPGFTREDSSFFIEGSMKIEDFNNSLLFSVLRFGGLGHLGEDIESSAIPLEQGSETMGGFVFNLFGRLPQEGERVQYGGLEFTVTKVTGKRISQLRVERLDTTEALHVV